MPGRKARKRGPSRSAAEKKSWPVIFARVRPELRKKLGVYLIRQDRSLEDVVAEALEEYLRRHRGQ